MNVNKVGNKASNILRLIKYNFLVPDGYFLFIFSFYFSIDF